MRCTRLILWTSDSRKPQLDYLSMEVKPHPLANCARKVWGTLIVGTLTNFSLRLGYAALRCEVPLGFLLLLEVADLRPDRAAAFLLVEERADVDFLPRLLRRFALPSCAVSRLTILLKLLLSPPAVSS